MERHARYAYVLQGVGFILILVAAYILIALNGEWAQPEETELPAVSTNEISMTNGTSPDTTTLSVTSAAFAHDRTIPAEYTCDGEGKSPPLAISSIDPNAVSLVLIVDDPDAPGGVWDHWVMFNLLPENAAIAAGETPPGMEGKNSWGRVGYGGPCPPDGEHRYIFRVYALDTMLDLPEGATKADVERAMEGSVLQEAMLVGRYAR